ncbi:hypothetical protein ACQKWADRAFT_257715 [Trichoderma austrokoningii]
MAFKLFNFFALLLVLCGLAAADYGALSAEVVATPIYGRQSDLLVYRDNVTVANSSVMASPSSMTNSPSKSTNRRLLNADLANIVMQEPGFVLLSLSFAVISGGMVFL